MQSANVVIHQRYTVLPVDSIETFICYGVVDNLTLVVSMWLKICDMQQVNFGTF